jgi:hypothetical protein
MSAVLSRHELGLFAEVLGRQPHLGILRVRGRGDEEDGGKHKQDARHHVHSSTIFPAAPLAASLKASA